MSDDFDWLFWPLWIVAGLLLAAVYLMLAPFWLPVVVLYKVRGSWAERLVVVATVVFLALVALDMAQDPIGWWLHPAFWPEFHWATQP